MSVSEPPAASAAGPQPWGPVLEAAAKAVPSWLAGDRQAAGQEVPGLPPTVDPAAMMKAGAEFWTQAARAWGAWMGAASPMGTAAPAALSTAGSPAGSPAAADPASDKRFRAPEWRQPPFDGIARAYLTMSERLIAGAQATAGMEPAAHDKMMFAVRAFLDAVSPSNFPMTNPQVIARTVETGGANLTTGLERMVRDIAAKQLTHTDAHAFAVGRNLAMTPGKVVFETPLYQLIHYAPTTDTVFETPLVIFPPWINRFYILDLTPAKSFVRWAVEQGVSVFMVSWKSADATIAHVALDDYVAAQIEAVDTVRDLLDVPTAHTIGYCVAGTTLAATLALLDARGEADKVASATFFTAQVDFADAGELKHFLSDDAMTGIAAMSAETGTLDGRYMAAVFNSLRGRDLIWSSVVDNYMLGKDYAAFDLLHWNGDTTNLPAAWHADYLENFYRGNKLATGGVVVDGVSIDLARVKTPAYVQAGREDHIAPPESVFKITHHFAGPVRFVLAGSGHIAGVVNPPSANKYGYSLNEAAPTTLAAFKEGATEHKGSWWPDWLAWLAPRSGGRVEAIGARVPGDGKLPAIEDAPGRYVMSR